MQARSAFFVRDTIFIFAREGFPMNDPNRPFMDPEDARQAAQQGADAARSGDALPAGDALPTAGDAAENLEADDLPAASEVALPESPALADGMAQPGVLGADALDAVDVFSSAASSESGDDMLGDLDLGPWLSDSEDVGTDAATNAETGAESSGFSADFASGAMPSISDGGGSVEPFAASPPPFTGPLVEVSPGVFVCPEFRMPWSTDAPAQATLVGEDIAWLTVALDVPLVPTLADKVLQHMAEKFNRDIDQKLESHTNEIEFMRAAQMRALYGR
jgi:hypothetical protein